MEKSLKHIVHVSEVLATGILEYIRVLVKDVQPFQHSIIYRIRDLGHDDVSIKEIFPPNVQLVKWTQIDRPINLVKDTSASLELYRLMKQLKPDIVHLHSSKAGFLGRIVAPFFVSRQAILYTPNGAPFARTDISTFKKKLFQLCEKFANVLSGKVICVSQSEAQLYKAIEITAFCINNGVDTPKNLKPQETNDTFKIISSGRITKQKNPERFNDIAHKFKDNAKVQFIWVGDGGAKKKLASSNIKITGWLRQEEVAKEIASANIYLSTSSWEGLPFSVLEAMSMGLPVILNNCVGNKDLVKQKHNGFLFDTNEEAIKYIEQLLEKPDYAQTLGKNSVHFCQQHFSKNVMVQSYFNVYSKLV